MFGKVFSSRVAIVAIGAFVLMIAFSGMAFAGVLPAPVQDGVSNAAQGVHINVPAADEGNAGHVDVGNVQNVDQGAVNQTDVNQTDVNQADAGNMNIADNGSAEQTNAVEPAEPKAVEPAEPNNSSANGLSGNDGTDTNTESGNSAHSSD
ncbi:MAG: hypothetical protein ACYCXF_07420 [Thermoleophilia bacterium]